MHTLLNDSKQVEKSRCRKLTKTETILAVLLTGAICCLLYIKITAIADEPPPECEDTSCYETIIEIQKFIDRSTDPCEDFHEFGCGGFFKDAAKKQITSLILEEKNELENELTAMMIEPVSATDSNAIKIQKMFFKACMDIYQTGVYIDKRILNLIDQIGGWPLSKGSNWKSTNFDWMRTMLKCKNLGLPFEWFLKFSLHVQDDINYLKVSFPTADFDAFNDKKAFMERIITSILQKKVNVIDLMAFNDRLTKIILKENSEFNLISIADLQAKFPKFSWLQFLNNLTKDNYEFTEETQVATNVENYIKELHQLLQKTPKNVQADYIVWKIVEFFAPHMSYRVRRYMNAQNTVDFCTKKTRESFPYFTEVEYIRKYSTEDVKKPVYELATAIGDEFLAQVDKWTWLNTTVMDIFWKKIESIKIDVGLDLGNIDLDANYFHLENLTLSSENPDIVELTLERSKNYYNSIFRQINQTGVGSDVKQLLLRSMKMEIFFDEASNKIIIPPAVLHGFLYDHRRPQYLNFASLGTLLARGCIQTLEIVSGNIMNVADMYSLEKCFADDFSIISNKTYKNFDLIQKIVPDIVARDIAYSAYQKWVEKNGEETELPLLSYNSNQLFWIKSSLINCRRKTPGEKVTNFDQMTTKYTNVMSARHSRHFADDFGCPTDAPMNPTPKC